MKNLHNWINTGLSVALLVLVLVGGNQSVPNLGGSTSATWTAANLVSNGTLTVAGATILTGAITITGSSTAGTVTAGSVVNGNSTTTVASFTTTTLTAAQICGSAGVLEFVPAAINASITMPVASSTSYSGCLNYNGSWKQLILRNASGTDATGVILASSTSVIIRYASTTGESFKHTSSSPAILTFVKTSSSTMEVLVAPFRMLSSIP